MLWRFVEGVAYGFVVLRNLLLVGVEWLAPGERPALPLPIGLSIRSFAFLVAGWLAVIYFLPPAYFLTGMHRNLEHRLAEVDRHRLTPMLFDAKGRFLGAMPFFDLEQRDLQPEFFETEASFGRRYAAGPAPLRAASRKEDLSESYWSTVFVEEPNRDYISCLQLLEDRGGGGSLGMPFGVDVMTPRRMAWYTLRQMMRGRVRFAGGSTLVAQFQQRLGYEKNELGPIRKFSEYAFRTPVMAHYVQGDGRRYAQLAARALPHAKSIGSGRDLMGLEMGARVLFGKSQSQLSSAEAYALAASINRLPEFGIGESQDHRYLDQRSDSARQERWAGGANCRPSGVVCRAELCAQSPDLQPDPAKRDQALAALREMAKALPLPHAAPGVVNAGYQRRVAARGDQRLWWSTARDPLKWMKELLPREQEAVHKELQNAFGHNWGSAVNAIRLTFDIDDEVRFSLAFDARIREWFRDQRSLGRLNPAFSAWADGADTCNGSAGGCPDVVLAVADPAGRIVRYYASSQTSSYYGSGPGNAYRWENEDRQLASIAKIGAALIFARAGRPLDADLLNAFAWSHSAKIEEKLIGLGAVRCAGLGLVAATVCYGSNDVQPQLRWSDKSSWHVGLRRDNPSRAFSWGTLSASPRTVHHDVSAILNAFLGRTAPVRAPSMVEQVTYLDFPAGRLDAPRNRLPDYEAIDPALGGADPLTWLRTMVPTRPGEFFDRVHAALDSRFSVIYPDQLVPAGQRPALLQLLRSPICYHGGGTLRGLSHWCGRTRLIFGKTGTYDISSSYSGNGAPEGTGKAHTLWVAGGVQFQDARAYSFVLMIAGPTPKEPIALPRGGARGDLEGEAAAVLIDFVLRDVSGQDRATSERGARSSSTRRKRG